METQHLLGPCTLLYLWVKPFTSMKIYQSSLWED